MDEKGDMEPKERVEGVRIADKHCEMTKEYHVHSLTALKAYMWGAS